MANQSKTYVKVLGVQVPVSDSKINETRNYPRISNNIDPKFRGTNKYPTIPGGFCFEEKVKIPAQSPVQNMCPQCGRVIDKLQSLCNIALRGNPCYSKLYKDIP